MTKRIGLTAMVLAVVMLCALVFAACAPDGDIDSLDSIPELISKEESKADESEEVSVEEGQAHPPVVKDVIHVTEKTVIIAGGCDEGCTVTVTDGSTEVSTASISGYFILEYTIDSTNFSILSLTAQSETLKESPITALRVEYDSTAMKRIDGYGANVGKDSQVYYDFDLASYTGVINNIDKTTSSTLLTQTELRKFRERVSTYLKNFRKRADNDNVDIIYVLIPNKVTVYPEYLVEGTEQQNYKTRYEQIVESLGMTDVITIDMRPVFEEEKAKGTKLYYDTDSHITEYAGYLVYKAICDQMAIKHPNAAARDLETEFTAKEVTFYGGDVIRHLGIDRTHVTETATVYKPKFTLNIGAEDDVLATESGFISKFEKYAESDSMLLNSAVETLAYKLLFATNRKQLPCALIYRDSSAVNFSDILCERFNRVMLNKVGDFNINLTDTQRYYGYNAQGKENRTVDYIIIICSESYLDGIARS